MQKILYFEIATAIKDRPKAFQVITLVLFAFSLTMILVGSLVRLSVKNPGHVVKTRQVKSYTEFVSSPHSVVGLQK